MKNLYDLFIEKAVLANNELFLYLKTKLSKEDYQTSGKIGYGGDETKNIDSIAEEIFIDHLLCFCDIFSEERGLIVSDKNLLQNSLILLDPLDGSENFISGIPYYGTSISLQVNGITKVGLVYNLVDGTYFFRTPNKTNFQNDRCLRGTFGIFERAYRVPIIVEKLYEENLKFRSPGATALSLIYTHNITFFLLAGKMREFDVDAGLYICKDFYKFQNQNFLLVSKEKKIFQKVKEIIKLY